MLRVYFRYDRKVMDGLSRVADRAVSPFMKPAIGGQSSHYFGRTDAALKVSTYQDGFPPRGTSPKPMGIQ
jgi:hypothetical protein